MAFRLPFMRAPKPAPAAPQVRRFDAAAGGRRWDARPAFGRIGAETLAASYPVRQRARYFVANNAWAASGLNALVTGLVGAGIVSASAHPDEDRRQAIGVALSAWAARADMDGLTDLYGLQAAAVRDLARDGEALIQFITTADGLRLRHLPVDVLDTGHTAELANGGRIVAGVEFDSAGRRVAYHLNPAKVTDTFDTFGTPIRVPAADVIHLLAPMGAGQVRGVSWFAPVLLRLSEMDQLEDALLVGVKVAAMHAGFLVDQNGSAGESPFEGQQIGSVMDSGLEPGTLRYLPQGWDVKFSTPAQAQQSVEFAQLQLRAVAAGLGIPEHLLTGDLRGANYSSLRAGLVAYRQRLEQIQFQTIIPQLVRPIFERAVTSLVLSGELDAPDFEARMADYLAAEFYPPAQPWVDPKKDIEAEALAVKHRFKSRRQVVAAQGYSVEALDAEIAADAAREAALGFTPEEEEAGDGA